MEYNAYYNCINMQFHTKYWFKTLNLISLLQNSIIALWGNNQSCMLTVVAGQAHYIIIYDFISFIVKMILRYFFMSKSWFKGLSITFMFIKKMNMLT